MVCLCVAHGEKGVLLAQTGGRTPAPFTPSQATESPEDSLPDVQGGWAGQRGGPQGPPPTGVLL